jgi:hypothetical protein
VTRDHAGSSLNLIVDIATKDFLSLRAGPILVVDSKRDDVGEW